jgi:hypothetical protein
LGTNLSINYAFGIAILIANILFGIATWLSSLENRYKLIVLNSHLEFVYDTDHQDYKTFDEATIGAYQYRLVSTLSPIP